MTAANRHSQPEARQARKQRAEWLDRFEAAWQAGARPTIADYLPVEAAERRAALIELVHAELEFRLKAGESVQAADYLNHYPELANDPQVVHELRAAEEQFRPHLQVGAAEIARTQEPSRPAAPAVTGLNRDRATPPARANDARGSSGGSAEAPADSGEELTVAMSGRRAGSPPPAVAPETPAAPLPELLDYEILAELGRGGMGIVYKARQLSLDRVVAIKMIRTDPHLGPVELARFHAEAEVVARLQHPNIVHILEVGQQGGRPYFSLEYIDGGSLAKRIAGQPQPALPAAQLVEVLARAIHYAHECGIIHRDLKPGNILLGTSGAATTENREPPAVAALPANADALFPTPKITDFGLARRLDNSQHPTCTGAILGTPSYMAPEQAEGKARACARTTDVYALGVILYELLTGRPPFVGASSAETFLQVISSDPVPPSALQPKTPRDLETTCLKCLQKEPHRRYPTAEALADDLHRFQAGQAILARPSTALERLVKWGKRRPAAAAFLSVGVVAVPLLLSISLGFNVLLQRKNDLLEQAAERERLVAQEVRQQRDKARRHFQLARSAVDQFHAQVGENPEDRDKGVETLRTEVLETALDFYEQFVRETEDNDPELRSEQARAYQHLADLYYELGKLEQAEQACQKALAIRQHLVPGSPAEGDGQSELAESYFTLGVLNRARGRRDRAESAHQQALDIRQQLVAAHPEIPEYRSDLATSHNSLGLLFSDSGHLEQAECAYQKARAVRQHLAETHPTVPRYQYNLARSYSNLGSLYRTTGRSDLSESAYREALRIRRQLVDAYPKCLIYQHHLAESYRAIGLLYRSLKRWPDAERVFHSALDICQQLVALHPEVTRCQSELANCQHYFGLLYKGTNRLDLAEQANQKAADIRRKLVTDHPEVPTYQTQLASTLQNLGSLYRDTARRAEAEKAYREALVLNRRLTVDFPEHLDYATSLGSTCHQLGALLQERCDPQEALNWYDQAIRTLQGVLQREPRHSNARSFLLQASQGRARFLDKLGRPAEAVPDWERAIELASGPEQLQAHLDRALSLARAGDHVQAAAAAKELAQLKLPAGRTYYTVARILSLSTIAVSQDSQFDPASRERLAEQYALRSIAYLVQAEKVGYFEDARRIKSLQKERDLKPLHTRADFQKWLDSLTAEP